MNSTSVEAFLDTNILVYSVSTCREELHKAGIAASLAASKNYGLSAQVLQEFFVVVTRKGENPLSREAAESYVREFAERTVVPLDSDLVLSAISVARRFGVSYWDAAILAAAEKLGAKTLYSEDLAHGQSYGSVQVLNPFRELAPQNVPA